MRPLRATDWADAESHGYHRISDDTADRRGHRLPETLDAIRERNRLVVEASRHFAGSDRQVAHELRQRLAIYATGRWRRSRADPVNPHEAGTLAATMWAILKARDHVPSTRSMRRTLAAIHGPRGGV